MTENLLLLDFDGTVYSGDSSKDFFLFVLRRHPRALSAIPGFLASAARYARCQCSKECMKEHFFAIVKYVPDIDREILTFWDVHQERIMRWYSARPHESDVIISASPEFLIAPIGTRLGVKDVIATKVDPQTGRFLSPNCYGAEKVTRFKTKYGNAEITAFYTNSKSDRPLAELADQAFFVQKGGVLTVFKEEILP